MVKVTAPAKNKLKEDLLKQKKGPELAIRIVMSDSTPKRFEFLLDREREYDQIVESEDGTKILLIDGELSSKLDGKIIDYQETSQGAGFTLIQAAQE